MDLRRYVQLALIYGEHASSLDMVLLKGCIVSYLFNEAMQKWQLHSKLDGGVVLVNALRPSRGPDLVGMIVLALNMIEE